MRIQSPFLNRVAAGALMGLVALAASASTLRFNGTDSRVQRPGVVGFPTTAITTEFWVRTAGPDARCVFSYSSSTADNEWTLFTPGNLRIHVGSSGTAAVIDTGVSILDGQWHHVAVSWRNSDSQVEVHVDGVSVHTSVMASRVGYVLKNGGFLALGQDQDSFGGGFSDTFQGVIDEFRIWNRVLTTPEVQQNMNRSLAGNEPGLFLYYPVTEIAGSVTFDAGTNHLHGFSVGGVSRNLAEDATATPMPFLPTVSSVTSTGAVVTVPVSASHGPVTNVLEWGAGSDAMNFDTTDEIFIDPAPNLANRSFSFEYWARRPASAVAMFPFSLGTSATRSLLHAGWRAGDDLTFAFFNDDFDVQADIDDSDWHHFAFTFDTNTLQRCIYVDGIQVGQDTAGGNFVGTGPLRLGRYIASNSQLNFDGYLDEVRIWQDVVLTSAIIREWKDKELDGSHPDFAALAGYWPFSEGSGVEVMDASGNGFHGVYVQNPVRVKGARPVFTETTTAHALTGTNRALNLDGVDDFVDVPDGVWFNGSDNFTIEARVYVRSHANYSRLIDFGNGAPGDNVLFVLTSGTSGQFYLGVQKGAVLQSVTSPVPVPLNEWAHLAVTWSNGTTRLHLNGVQVASGTVHAPNAVIRTKNYIGESNWPADAAADTLFDFVRIWNVARTPGELAAFQAVNVSPDAIGLMLNYQFDEGAGTVAVDSRSASPQNGVLTNSPTWKPLPSDVAALINLDPGTTYHVRSVAANTNGTVAGLPVQFATLAPGRGSALEFDGVDDYIRISDLDADAPLTEVTVEFWQRVHALKNQSPFSLEPDMTGNRMQAHTPWSNGTVYWDFGNISGSGRLTYPPPVSLLGEWNHFAFVSSQAGNYMRIYRNGVLEAQRVGMDPREIGSFDLILGRYTLSGTSYYLDGELDEIRVWNLARSAEEIQENMNVLLPDALPGMLVHLRMDEGGGLLVNDVAGMLSVSRGLLLGRPRWVPSEAPVGVPLAITTLATEVGFGFATMNGTVNLEDSQPASWWFEYGLNGVLGGSTSAQVLSPGITLQSVSEALTNLLGGKVYSYRLVAANGNGTNYGAVQTFYMPFPASGYALAFDGTNYVNMGDSTALKVSTAISAEAWIYPTGPGTGGATGGIILNKEGEYEFARFADGTLRWAMNITTPKWVWINSGIVAPLNQWMHVAFTYDGANVRLYTNGVLAKTMPASGAVTDFNGTLNELWIGSRQAGGQNFQGAIDEVRVWNVTRSAIDIAANHNRLLTGSEPGLLLYLSFDEGSGETTYDRGPQHFIGALVDSPVFILSGALPTGPLVTTLAPAPVLATTATLRGTVNPSGDAATIARFEYGPTIAYGNSFLITNTLSGLQTLPLSATLTNLEPGTTYHYRMVAYNAVNTNHGLNQTFTTLVLGCGWPVSTKITGGESLAPRHVVDAEGNTYIAGLFSGTASFVSSLTATGAQYNAFVGRISRGGDWTSAIQIPVSSNGTTRISAVGIDPARNIYVAGQFSGTNTFGGAQLVSNGDTNLFVAKLDPTGTNWLWAIATGGTGLDAVHALAIGGSNNIFVAGQFSGTANFSVTNLTSGGGSDVFAARLDPAGNWLWARAGSGAGASDAAYAIVTDSITNVYVAGQISGSATFGSFALTNAGGADVFVAKLSPLGTWVQARRGGSTNHDVATALVGDLNQFYLAGQFGGTAKYGDSLDNLNVGSATNTFVMKLNAEANVTWYAQGGSGAMRGVAVSGDRVYASGDFSFLTQFGSNPFLTSAGNRDVYLAQLDAATGNWLWSRRVGSSGTELASDVQVDGGGSVVFSGTYQNTVEIGYVALTTPNSQDIFVARINGNQVFEHNNHEIGIAITVPAEAIDPGRTNGGAIGRPDVIILEKQHGDSDELNSFVWSPGEKKLYPVRPVTALIKWPLTAGASNAASFASCVGTTFWPVAPRIHVANAPADLEPDVPGFLLRFLDLSFTTSAGASVDAGEKLFNAAQPGWSVIQLLDTGGAAPDPGVHPSVFEVVRTVAWDDPQFLTNNIPAAIGAALTHPAHEDPMGLNGYVYFENAFYDGAGDERAYDRAGRTGPIIPVNKDTTATNDDLVVVWYATAPSGIAWPGRPVRYVAEWPADAEQLVIASRLGSGVLGLLDYPSKRVYSQPDKALPGYNPNEEHAALYGDVLFALRNDLNNVLSPKVSEPYVLLKYLNPGSGDWAMKVYHVVVTNSAYPLTYAGVAGDGLLLPEPLTYLDLCSISNRIASGPGYQDYAGRLYARAAGPGLGGTNIVAHYWYPLQPGFFYDLNLDGASDAPVGTCLPWLDRRPGGVPGTPVNVSYSISWPTPVASLQIGETLFGSKLDAGNLSLPDIRNFADARVIYDQGNPLETNALGSLVRLYDPLSERMIQLPPGFTLPAGVVTANVAGRLVFVDLPFSLRARLRFDDLNKRLSFGGLLDESVNYGGPQNPLLLINVLSPRERDRIVALSTDATFRAAVTNLYDLTRNPNRLDVDQNGQPDKTLLIGLAYEYSTNQTTGLITTNIAPEVLGDGPKALTAAMGTGSGFVTVVENDNPALGGLPVTLHVIRIAGGPYRGDIKVLYSDNVFDEKLTLRHSADFGAEPQNFEFEWYYQPDQPGFDRTDLPVVDADGTISDPRGWLAFPGVPPGVNGFNDITIGDGGQASLLTLADNWFICRYRGYTVGTTTNEWTDWVGVIGGGEAQLAEGWVKRVVLGLNPFEARTTNFHASATVTFASMLQQAGPRYEGDIAFNSAADNINTVGLISAYRTVLNRAGNLSINATPGINYAPANNALLLAASRISDFYMLLGNEAYADAADPTIGFRTDDAGYGTLAPSIFTFQNQLDSLLEEELGLLRGRDDRSATVRAAPAYNRLFWNFTSGEGEVAYAQAYNITDQNDDGLITSDDARIMYPQGHGDAWGHYLTATKLYYSLLQNANFDWIARSESILLAGVPVAVDYLDERKFARAAAAKARTGAELVDLTYRINYVDDPAGQFQGYKDTDTSRAWGLSEWAHRAGSAAFFDWVTVNAVLPATDPNTNHVGIQKIDRTTVAEIGEILAGYENVQSQLDKADRGMNPLGLVKNAVPFDIDPALISSGKTHFEQIYERAIDAVENTLTVFDHANQLSQALRRLQDSVNDFSQNAEDQERDHKNRLIEIFGYPYAGDVGVGRTYPSGYDGPDLYHYMYVDAVELTGDTAPPAPAFTAFFNRLSTAQTNISHFFPEDLPALQGNVLTQNVLSVSYPQVAADYAFVPPASWGQRRSPGELQTALSTLLQKEAALKRALENYDQLIAQINDSIDLLEARYAVEAEQLRINNVRRIVNISAGTAQLAAIASERYGRKGAFVSRRLGDIASEGFPKVVGVASDVTSVGRVGVLLAAEAAAKPFEALELVGAAVNELAKVTKQVTQSVTEEQLRVATLNFELQQRVKELEQLLREEGPLRLEIFELREAVNQAGGEYLATLSRGLRLVDERIAFRKNAAAETQASRYQDMTFRVFRNDAIQKYRAQYDLAARYVFLAAVAYDFETQLLGGQTGAGREFLTDIIRQRALGQVENGVPIAGRHGLADPLARLNQNFSVLKGQLGFNNPQTETGQFSLRGGLFRMRDSSHAAWQAELRKHIVPDLWQLPEFRRYCRPFAPESAGPQPGLVIRFPTTVTFGLNYFGWPLGGGDSAYDSTLFATKVRSAGVWFSDYNGSGLSITPRVYLVPAGADILRSPSGDDLETREWRVVDQKIPVPFPIGFSSLNDPAWIPVNDSLSDTFADIRRFSSFRAYHDSGVFNPAETVSDSRLIGRSVWNTDWMLIIPGGTFLFDPDEGLGTFIESVTDIKIFYQTYAYSGN